MSDTDIRTAITRIHHEDWARVVALTPRRFGDLDLCRRIGHGTVISSRIERHTGAARWWQAEGLLDRQANATDARSRRLALTAEGRHLQGLLDEAGAEAERAWTDLVGADTLQIVKSALAAYARSPEPVVPVPPLRIRFA